MKPRRTRYWREYARAKRKMLRAAGLCLYCKERKEEERNHLLYCAKCYEMLNRKSQARAEKMREWRRARGYKVYGRRSSEND